MKTRWLRWLGAMCRADRPTWLHLLEGSYTRWANAILLRTGEEQVLGVYSTQAEVKAHYRLAIERATETDLRKLDSLYIAYNAR